MNILRVIQGWAKIKGDSDGTFIGNSGDSLKTSLTNDEFNAPTVKFEPWQYDAVGRIRVSDHHTLFDACGGNPFDTTRYWSTETTGGGTVTAASNGNPSRVLSVGTASGDEAIIQTIRRVQYNRGHSQYITFTGKFETPKTNLRQRYGYFCGTHGLFFEHDGTNLKVVRRSSLTGSTVDTAVNQSSWNVDKLDGTGPSGLTVDIDTQLVFGIDFLWLGSKQARFYIVIEEKLILVHVMKFSNVLTLPYMDIGMAPIRMEITNTGTTASASSISFTCAAVKSEGAPVEFGDIRVVDTGTTAISISSTELVVAGIRLNSSYINGAAQPIAFNLLPTSGNSFAFYKVVFNPTLTGATWTAASEGIVDLLTNNPTYTGGSVINSGFIQLGSKNQTVTSLLNQAKSNVFLGSLIDGTATPLVLTIQTLSGTGSVLFSGSYREYQ